MRAAKQTLLWSFKKPEGNTSFVFGTMHVRDAQAFYLEKEVIPYLESCVNFAAELNLNEAGLEQASVLHEPAPVKLSEMLTQAQFRRLDRCCRKYLFLPASAFDAMHPMMLIQLFTARILQTNRPVSLDQTLWNYADSAGKKCSGLETWEEQLADFHNISVLQQKRALLQVIRNFGKFRKQLLKLMKYYLEADLRSLYISTKKSLGNSRAHLLYKRNERLTDRMVTIGRESSLFAAVGAAHLWGKFGIIRLLKKKGFQVKPVAIQLSDLEHGDQEE